MTTGWLDESGGERLLLLIDNASRVEWSAKWINRTRKNANWENAVR